MKVIIFIIAIALILGIGAVGLYAMPQAVPAGQRMAAQEMSSTTAFQQGTSSAPIASSTSAARPLATHTVGTATATPLMISEGTSTQVSVSVQITDPALIATSVNLLRLGATGTQPAILGVMKSSGNGMYTLQPTFNEATPGQIQLQVSAAFVGTLQRVLSNVVTVSAWGVLTDATSGFTALYPPNLYNVPPGHFALQSSAGGVDIGGAPPPGGPVSATGYSIAITPVPYNVSSTFDINQYLSVEYSNSYIDTITSTTIGGAPGYVVTFTQEEGGGQPLAIVYHNGYAYEISYDSTVYIDGFSDQQGLSDFNQILQHFTFN